MNTNNNIWMEENFRIYSIFPLYTAWDHRQLGKWIFFIGFLRSEVNVQAALRLNFIQTMDPLNNVFLRKFKVVFSRQKYQFAFLGLAFIHLIMECRSIYTRHRQNKERVRERRSKMEPIRSKIIGCCLSTYLKYVQV